MNTIESDLEAIEHEYLEGFDEEDKDDGDIYPSHKEREMLSYYFLMLETENSFNAFYATQEKYPTLQKVNGFLILS